MIVECDSDDFFADNSFNNIKKSFNEIKDDPTVYAMCFLKYDLKGNNIGKEFKKRKTTMFDLYFKDGEDGEKALVYITEIRKKYKYKLEKSERFGTEARLHHEMDLNYSIICFNEPLMLCEYQKDGYTKNIDKIFMENPYGYYEYFKEILNRNMNGVLIKKRLYVIKHYILFKTLTNEKSGIKNIKDLKNKLLYLILLAPGTVVTKRRYKHERSL